MLIMFYTSRQSTFYYDIWILIFIYFGILILSYTLAVPFCLLFELPILKLEKLVLNHKPKQSILNENQKNYASTNILDFSEPTNGMKE
uniref:Uncharacterized protein n=1 Tax=Strigamia maritima TaxID=126957 RepID=T1IWN2_STRMM